MTMSELKNCPCCGHGSDCNNRGLVDHEGNALWWVECLGCGLSTHGHKTRQEAVAAWNRRADGWRPASEPPERDKEVLVIAEVIGGGLARGRLGRWEGCDNGWKLVGLDATVWKAHWWLPIPEPPKEEDDA